MAFRAGAFLILPALLMRAQTPAQEVVIRTHPYAPPSTILHAESNLVEAGLTVRDSNGRAVAGLHASDFEIFDNGVPQTITAFNELRTDAKPAGAAPTEPTFVTFFFDDLHTGKLDMPFVKQAARAFAVKYLRPGNRVSIATTSGAGDLDFTGDATRFAEKADRLMSRVHIYHSLDEYHADSLTTLSELGSAAQRLAEAPGMRILVFVSSDFIIHVGNEHDVESEV